MLLLCYLSMPRIVLACHLLGLCFDFVEAHVHSEGVTGRHLTEHEQSMQGHEHEHEHEHEQWQHGPSDRGKQDNMT